MNAAEVRDCQTVLDAFVRKHFADRVQRKRVAVPERGGAEPPLDEQILAKAQSGRNGSKFGDLYFNGDWQKHGYPSQSEADLALCSILAFYCGPDPAGVDRLFRGSTLSDEKWNRDDYREATIRKAIEGCTDFYRWRVNGNGQARQRAYKLTDYGNAERLCDAHGRDVRYCHPTGRWLVWDGTLWKADETGAVARLAKRTIRTIWSELGAIDDEERRKKLAQHAAKSESSARIAGLLSLAESEQGIPVLPDQLDRDIWALNTPSGTVDLRTGELRPHRREDLITKTCPVPYDPGAQSDLWEKFIQRMFDGDAELIRFVQRWLGYRLTGAITEQKLPIFWGDGNNGKSTLLDTVVYIMGDYADEAPPQLLTERRGGDEHPTEIAGLQGKRLIVASETEKGRRLRLQLMKMLTGNARLRARFTKKDYFTFDRTFEPVLVTNNKPKIREDTTAVWRRIRLVPFRVAIPKHEIDDELPQKLKAEAPAILRWLIEGCLEWQQHGLVEPQAVTLATGQYRAEADPLRDFLMESCVIDPIAWTKTGALRRAYEDYCAERGDKPVPGPDFTDSLRQVGCQPERRHAGRGWLGIRLLADVAFEPAGLEERF